MRVRERGCFVCLIFACLPLAKPLLPLSALFLLASCLIELREGVPFFTLSFGHQSAADHLRSTLAPSLPKSSPPSSLLCVSEGGSRRSPRFLRYHVGPKQQARGATPVLTKPACVPPDDASSALSLLAITFSELRSHIPYQVTPSAMHSFFLVPLLILSAVAARTHHGIRRQDHSALAAGANVAATHFVLYSESRTSFSCSRTDELRRVKWVNQGVPPPSLAIQGWNTFALSFCV